MKDIRLLLLDLGFNFIIAMIGSSIFELVGFESGSFIMLLICVAFILLVRISLHRMKIIKFWY